MLARARVAFSRSLSGITRAVLGPLQTNCYLLTLDKQCLVVDPAASGERIIDWIRQTASKSATDIYLTHGHFDHISAVPALCDAFPDARIFASKLDLDLYVNSTLNLSYDMRLAVNLKDYLKKMQWIEDGQILEFGNDSFKVIGLPGHSPGSTGLLHEPHKLLFAGDTLFQGSVGNTDLPRANYPKMMDSIMTKLMKLNDDIVVLSGHGEPTTIGEERKTNPFILAEIRKNTAESE
jgi:hydroxyacylglutathione hydrolase